MDSLKLSRHWTDDIEVVIIGVEPAQMEWGLGLSPELQARLSRITEVVLREAG